jgi:hypothetical protein
MWATALDSVINVGNYILAGNVWPPPKARPIWKPDSNFPESAEAEAFWCDVFANTFGNRDDRLECYRDSMPFGKFLGRGAQGSQPPDIGTGDGAVEVKKEILGQLNDSPLTAILHDEDPKIPKLFKQRGIWKNHIMKMWYAFSHPLYGYVLMAGSVVAPDWYEYGHSAATAIKTMLTPRCAAALVDFINDLPNKSEDVCQILEACKMVRSFNSQPTNEIARFPGFGIKLQYLRVRPMFGISQKEFKPVLQTMLSQVSSKCRFVLLMSASDYTSYDAERQAAVGRLLASGILHIADGESLIEGAASKMIWIP